MKTKLLARNAKYSHAQRTRLVPSSEMKRRPPLPISRPAVSALMIPEAEMLGDQERAISGDRRQCDFDQRIVCAADDQQDRGADRKPDRHSAAERPEECREGRSRRLVDDPTAIADSTANPTAATPSLSRLSDSTTIETRGRQPISRNEAMTDTGSVAAIRTPNKAAPIQLQPTSQCMPLRRRGSDARPRGKRASASAEARAEPPPVELERGLEHQRRQAGR